MKIQRPGSKGMISITIKVLAMMLFAQMELFSAATKGQKCFYMDYIFISLEQRKEKLNSNEARRRYL
jgi:hypothetical protein